MKIPHINKSFIVLLNIVLLNCLGSGLIMLPPTLAEFGLTCFYAWVLTGLGAFGVGMTFVRLGMLSNKNIYSLQDLIAYPFDNALGNFLKVGSFWCYLIFLILGNAVLSVTLVNSLTQLIPWIPEQFIIFTHIIIFGFFYLINRFGLELSRFISILLVLIKLIIMIILPCIAYFLLPSNLPITTSSNIWIDLPKAIFITLWPFVGIESVIMEQNINIKQIRPAMITGLLICLAIYLFNTYIMFKNIPDLPSSASAYTDLFAAIFGSHSAWILHILIILISIGSLHGWTLTTMSTYLSDINLLPKKMARKNKHNVLEFALLITSIIPVFCIYIFLYLIKSVSIFNTLLSICSGLCLVIYGLGSISLLRQMYVDKKIQLLDLFYVALASIYTIFALIGSGFYFSLLSIGTFILCGIPALFFHKAKNQSNLDSNLGSQRKN